MSDAVAREILLAGADAIAHDDGLGPVLEVLIEPIGDLGVESAAIVVPGRDGALEVVATLGLDDAATAGLATAITRPSHPIAQTMHATTATFDVLPTVPGGPALRSHLPLVVTHGGADTILGVLALAHHRAIDPETRPILQAVADLAAVAVERSRSG